MHPFIYHYCVNHNAHPSFPTRRSSDLRGDETGRPRRARPGHNATSSTRVPESSWSRCDLVRSEEHTSELQSRQYLVCRLVLDKKKKEGDVVSNIVTKTVSENGKIEYIV